MDKWLLRVDKRLPLKIHRNAYFQNFRLTIAIKVVITWSRLAGMRSCPILSRSRQWYKLFMNNILRLHVQGFISARRDPSFVLLVSYFVRTKFSRLIISVHLSRMKKLINTSVWENAYKHISIDWRYFCCIFTATSISEKKVKKVFKGFHHWVFINWHGYKEKFLKNAILNRYHVENCPALLV